MPGADCQQLHALTAYAIIMINDEGCLMANLSVRKLNQEVYERLRVRAAKHGISMEEEARRIISQTVSAPEKVSEVFHNYFGRKNGVELEITKKHKPHKPMDFDE